MEFLPILRSICRGEGREGDRDVIDGPVHRQLAGFTGKEFTSGGFTQSVEIPILLPDEKLEVGMDRPNFTLLISSPAVPAVRSLPSVARQSVLVRNLWRLLMPAATPEAAP